MQGKKIQWTGLKKSLSIEAKISYIVTFVWVFIAPFCLCSIDFQKLPLDKRVSQALNGDLYFSNVLPEDSRPDYICYARFPHTQTIQQKQPISVTVLDSKTGCGTQLQSFFFLVDTSFMLFSDFPFFPPRFDDQSDLLLLLFKIHVLVMYICIALE